MTTADVDARIGEWLEVLAELSRLELRCAAAEARLPGDADVVQLRRDIMERRAIVIESCARLRVAADLLAPATLH